MENTSIISTLLRFASVGQTVGLWSTFSTAVTLPGVI